MSEFDRKRIFDKFYRSPKQAIHIRGTGLGLYFVKYFIELHGGTISLKSQEDYGTQVKICLPIC